MDDLEREKEGREAGAEVYWGGENTQVDGRERETRKTSRRDGRRAEERWTQEQEDEAKHEEGMGGVMMLGGGKEAATKEGQAEEGKQSLV